MDTFIQTTDFILFLCFSLMTVYLGVLAIAASLRNDTPYPQAGKRHRFAILVPPGSTSLPLPHYPEELYQVFTYEDLTEAIALGHDLGHTPFGHAGERALDAVNPDGFAHYKQSVRVAQILEKNGEGLNLTWEVRDGILNHRTSGNPSTLEGKVVRLSDKIAYIHHDMDDAQRAGIISEDDIPVTLRMLLGYTTRERLNTFVHDVIENSLEQDTIKMSAEIYEAMMDLRALMFQNVYENPAAHKEEEKVVKMLTELYEYYVEHPEAMSTEYRELIVRGEKKEQAVCDYLSGMTDQYSIRKFREIYIPKAWEVY